MTKHKLSATQEKAVALAQRGGGILERWRGGFWTYPGCPAREAPAKNGMDEAPEEYVPGQTIIALIAYGVVEPTKRSAHDRFDIEVRLAC